MENNSITWETLEYAHREHTMDWYWAVGIITLALAATSFILKNFLFALLIIIAAFTVIIFASRKPRHITFEINQRGIVIDKTLYPYGVLESFWVEHHETESRLLLKYNRAFVPHLIVPIADVDPDLVRNFLAPRLHEVEQHEALGQKIMEYLGF